MKNRIIRDRYAALTLLSQRALPSKTSINKVSALLTSRFDPAYQATEIARKNVIKDFPLADDHEGDTLPIRIAEERQLAMDEYMEQSQPIRSIPDRLRLKAEDMPKVLKGDDGWQNAVGVASIIVSLGSLYVREGDEKLDAFADDTAGEEPDEAPAPTPEDDMAPPTVEE